MRHRWIVRASGIALFLLIAIAGFGSAVLYLWNWLMPALFGLPAITFWQAVGLLALSWLLLGGWRGFGRGHWHGGWHRHWHERWQQMTPEQREEFRKAMEARCGRRRHMQTTDGQ